MRVSKTRAIRYVGSIPTLGTKRKRFMWILLQVIGCIMLAFALGYMRKIGLAWNSWLLYVSINLFFTSWAFSLSYKMAPSFLQVYFLGTALLTLFGFLGSIFYFKETVSIISYFGAGLTFVGACLIVLK